MTTNRNVIFQGNVMTVTELLQKLLVSANKRLHLPIQRKEKMKKNLKKRKKKSVECLLSVLLGTHNTSCGESFQLAGWRNVV